MVPIQKRGVVRYVAPCTTAPLPIDIPLHTTGTDVITLARAAIGIDILATADTAAAIDILATADTGGKMKVSELKEGMLLRFKEARLYRFLYDEAGGHWFDCGLFDKSMEVNGTVGQPLMVYLGQEKMKAPSHYGGFWNVRKVSVEGRVGWVFPDAWKSMEAV